MANSTAELKTPELNDRQQQALKFITDNINFFAAPFRNGLHFNNWILVNNLANEMKDFTTKSAGNFPDLFFFLFRDALYGKGNLDRGNALLRGNQERIKSLLQANEPLVDILIKYSKDTRFNQIIEMWNSHCKENLKITINTQPLKIVAKIQEEKNTLILNPNFQEWIMRVKAWEKLENDLKIEKEKQRKEAEDRLNQKRLEAQNKLIDEIYTETSQYITRHLCDRLAKKIKDIPVIKEYYTFYDSFDSFVRDIASDFPKGEQVDRSFDLRVDRSFDLCSVRVSITPSLKSLAIKYVHANKVKTIAENKSVSALARINAVTKYISQDQVKSQITEERGFWSRLLAKLGVVKSHGRKLVKFFTERYQEVNEKNLLKSENEPQTPRVAAAG